MRSSPFNASTFPILVVGIAVTAAAPCWAEDSRPNQDRYCAGMSQEKYLPLGGRYDCLNDTHVIEVEWSKDWYSAVGQVLYYAEETKRAPVLLCESAQIYSEGLCRSYVYRLDYALRHASMKVKVWYCAVDTDMTLDACAELDLPDRADP